MKRLFSFLIGITLSLVASENEFVLGIAGGYAPFVSLNNDGIYEGFDIDVANALTKQLNKKLVLKDLGSMPSLILALNQKKIDAVMWAVSITEERQKKIEMVHYQGKDTLTLPLLFWGKIPENIKSMEDFVKQKKVVSVEAGSSQEDFLRTIPNLKVKYVEKLTDAIMELRYGKTTAAMVDPSMTHGFLEKFKEIQVMQVPLPSDMQVHGIGICLNKADKKLIAEVREAIQKLKNDGTIAKLEVKWNIKD